MTSFSALTAISRHLPTPWPTCCGPRCLRTPDGSSACTRAMVPTFDGIAGSTPYWGLPPCELWPSAFALAATRSASALTAPITCGDWRNAVNAGRFSFTLLDMASSLRIRQFDAQIPPGGGNPAVDRQWVAYHPIVVAAYGDQRIPEAPVRPDPRYCDRQRGGDTGRPCGVGGVLGRAPGLTSTSSMVSVSVLQTGLLPPSTSPVGTRHVTVMVSPCSLMGSRSRRTGRCSTCVARRSPASVSPISSDTDPRQGCCSCWPR